MKDEKEIPSILKWSLWIAAWVVVLLIMTPTALLFAPFFPAGLFDLLPQQTQRFTNHRIWLLISWIPYLFLTWSIARAKKWWVFVLLYAIFCLLLIFNVVGCKRIFNELDAGLH